MNDLSQAFVQINFFYGIRYSMKNAQLVSLANSCKLIWRLYKPRDVHCTAASTIQGVLQLSASAACTSSDMRMQEHNKKNCAGVK